MLTSILRDWFAARRRKAAAPGLLGQHPPTQYQRFARPDLIFRLKAWPELPDGDRTADIYRMLSVMSSQPVNRQWLLTRSRMAPQQLDRFLVQLVASGALEVIDPVRFAGREPVADLRQAA